MCSTCRSGVLVVREVYLFTASPDKPLDLCEIRVLVNRLGTDDTWVYRL